MKAAQVENEIEGLEPAAAQAYLDQVEGTVGGVSLKQVEQAVADGDESRLQDLLALGLFALLVERLRSAYGRGASLEVAGIRVPGVRKEVDLAASRPAAFMSQQATALRLQTSAEQADAIRIVLSNGLARGDSYRRIALSLIGRKSPQTGRRTGGVVGLSRTAATSLENARTQLSSGSAAMLRDYLNRVRRDRSFDAAVLNAIKTGLPIKRELIERMVGAYADRLLITQAETIAQTAVAEAFNKGREEAWQQVIERSNGRFTFVKVWRARRDLKTRNSHAAMNGQRVAKDQPFQSPTGALLMFPCDPSMGAPMSERARCRCVAEYQLQEVNNGNQGLNAGLVRGAV